MRPFETLHSNHHPRRAEQQASARREQNKGVPQWFGVTEQRKVEIMQPVNQPSVDAPAPIGDAEDLAGRCIDLNPRVRAIIQHNAPRRIRERIGTHPVSIIWRNGLNSLHADR